MELIDFASVVLGASGASTHQEKKYWQEESREESRGSQDAQARAFASSHSSAHTHQIPGPFAEETHEGPRPIGASLDPRIAKVKQNVLILPSGFCDPGHSAGCASTQPKGVEHVIVKRSGGSRYDSSAELGEQSTVKIWLLLSRRKMLTRVNPVGLFGPAAEGNER